MVGDTCPDKLADGATTGPPKARRMSRATLMRRYPDGDGFEAGGGEVGDRAAFG